MEKMLDCSNLLTNCMESHMEQAQILLFSMPIDPNEWSQKMDHCQSQQRYRRSPKKGRKIGGNRGTSPGGSLGNTISSSLSRSSAPSSVRRQSSSGSVLKGILGEKNQNHCNKLMFRW